MTKSKIHDAVKMLLRPDEPDGIDDAYLESLVDEFERRRAVYARDVASWMSGDLGPLAPAQIGAIRAKYLDKLLSFRPHDMKAVLDEMMEDGEDFGRAASLLLYGHAQGIWQATEGQLAQARDLVREVLCPPQPKPVASPLTWADLGPPVPKRKPNIDLSKLKAVIQAHHHLLFVLGSPGATPRAKFAAISAWALALDNAGMADDVLDKDFLALLVVAGRTLAKVEQH